MVYHILSELKLAKENLNGCILLTPIVQWKEFKYYFVKKNLDKYQLISQIFSKNKYWLLYGKTQYNILQWKKQCFNNFYYATFIAYYTLEYKSIENCEYQSDELDDNLTGNGHGECSYPPKINLMILGETIRCRKAG